jgi:uncharacterized protein (DUF2141 family)
MRKIYLYILMFVHVALTSQTLKVSITGLRNNMGSVIMGFYNNDKAFEDEIPLFTKVESKASTVNHVLTLNYTGIKPGTYGIVLLDDENNNSKMDFARRRLWLFKLLAYKFNKT